MKALLYLIPIALALGGIGLIAFLWSLRSGQFDDPEGAANRILFTDDDHLYGRISPEDISPSSQNPVDSDIPKTPQYKVHE